MDEAPGYAFPHSAEDESRRLGLFQQRLDPLTVRRVERLGLGVGGPPAVDAGALTPEQATALVDRPTDPDFLACGFAHIGVWGRLPESQE